MVIIFSLILYTIHAWNADTHALVARIASRQLKQRSLARISRMLPEYESAASALTAISNWADKQSESDPYHFTHTPYRACRAFGEVSSEIGHWVWFDVPS